MPRPSNAILLDEIIDWTVDLRRFEQAAYNPVLALLKELELDLAERIALLSLDGEQSINLQRAERLLESTRRTIHTSYGGIAKASAGELLDVATFSQRFILDAFEKTFQADIIGVTLTPTDLRVLSSNTLIQNAPSAEWWARQEQDLTRRFAQEIRLGVAQGETNAQLVRRIRGRSTGRRLTIETTKGLKKTVHEFAGGVMDISTRDAKALVETSVQTISNEVLHKTYKNNTDVVEGVEALVTLDERTTIICIGLSGGAWDLVTGRPLPGSPRGEPFPGPPPWHWKCRSVLVPRTRSWNDLIEMSGGKRRKELERKVKPETRASMGGPTKLKGLTYEAWLKRQPENVQRRVLGADRFKLWKDDKINLSQLTSTDLKPIKVVDLKAGKGLPKAAPKK